MMTRSCGLSSTEEKKSFFHSRLCGVMGLNFVMSSFDLIVEHNMRYVKAYLQHVGHGVTSIENLQLRVAHILVLHALVLGIDLSQPVESWVQVLVDDFIAFAIFSWIVYAYKILHYYRTNMKSMLKYYLYGPSWTLFVWSLQVIRISKLQLRNM